MPPKLTKSDNGLPTISIIIPTYNRRHIIGDAIESVFSQDWPNIEIVVVDDGSTDKTAEFLQETYAGRIHLIHQDNRGPSAARNVGARASSGDFLAFLDSDDELVSGSLSARANVLLSNPAAGISYGIAQHQRRDGRWSKRTLATRENRDAWPYGDVFEAYLNKPFFGHTDILFRRALIPPDGKLYDEEMFNYEDYFMIMRLLARTTVMPSFEWSVRIRSLAGHERQRTQRDHVLQQGLAPLDRVLKDDVFAARARPFIDKIRAGLLLGMAGAAWHANDGRMYRHYLREAKAQDQDAGSSGKCRRRFFLSFLSFLKK